MQNISKESIKLFEAIKSSKFQEDQDMNKIEAIHFLSTVLPFAPRDEDYSSEFNGKVINNMEELLHILHNEFGELSMQGNHPELGDMYVTVSLASTANEYKTPVPSEANFKALKALYTLVP